MLCISIRIFFFLKNPNILKLYVWSASQLLLCARISYSPLFPRYCLIEWIQQVQVSQMVFLPTYKKMTNGYMFQQPSFPLLPLHSQKICRWQILRRARSNSCLDFWNFFFPYSRSLHMLFSAQNPHHPLSPQHTYSKFSLAFKFFSERGLS